MIYFFEVEKLFLILPHKNKTLLCYFRIKIVIVLKYLSMAGIFSFLFGGSKFISTKKYEATLISERESFIRFTKYANSELLSRFNELDRLIHSSEFKTKVNGLKKEKTYSNSEEKRLSEEYVKLQKNKELKWYFDTLKKKNFKELKAWNVTFEDDFEMSNLDTNKWMTGYYWGKTLMNDSYVLVGEKQFFQERNISIEDSVLRITTRKENARGKSWDPMTGFREKDFDYTSALISTGQSFRQQYGKFEAKVRFSQSFPVVNTFWMLGEKIAPQIDVFKSTDPKGKSLESGVHTMDFKNKAIHSLKKISGDKFRGKFFIYSLEWTSQALIWRINGTEVHRETKNIPNEAMYLTFCTTLPEVPKNGQAPAYMDIDWVRCYKKV